MDYVGLLAFAETGKESASGVAIGAVGVALAAIITACAGGLVTLVTKVMAAQAKTHRQQIADLKLVIDAQTDYYQQEIKSMRDQLENLTKRLIECESRWANLGTQAVTGSIPQGKGP